MIPTYGLPELEGEYQHGNKWKQTGHVDGVLLLPNGDWSLLEIKAIMNKSFERLLDTNDWRGMYGHYIPQIQSYMGFKKLGDYGGPMKSTCMVFKNRDTGYIMSPFPIDHDKHIQRKDMIEYRNPNIHQAIVDKLHLAAHHINNPDDKLPPCDYAGYCFYCQRANNQPRVGGGKTINLEASKEKKLVSMVKEYRRLKQQVKKKDVLAATILKALDDKGAETVRLLQKDKRNIIIKRWEFV
jgi:hypothetical protein